MSLDWIGKAAVAKGVAERRFDLTRATRTIPGLLWTPEIQPPKALVLLGHGGSGHKRQGYILALARRLVRHQGFAAAAIDGPLHGDRRRADGNEVAPDEFFQVWRDDPSMTDEMVADWRTVLDALQAPAVLGTTPVGWWGISMGTILGLPVVAAESRISVAVLGLMGIVGPTKQRLADDAKSVRCPVLFLVQWDDELFPRDRAFELFGAIASSDKRLHAHPGKHQDVPAEAFGASEDFLARTLAPG
ncbi:MAG TPA: alpha/beta hydrolase [Acidimicrobiia bacterium]|nr:alpha/beta hydrolase [Acidimicrobiia bacterium]